MLILNQIPPVWDPRMYLLRRHYIEYIVLPTVAYVNDCSVRVAKGGLDKHNERLVRNLRLN